MRIEKIDVQNFRKLKSCRIELSDEKTIFVGANNSGKTSAMDALIHLLRKDKRTKLTTADFTLSNWDHINKIGEDWLTGGGLNGPNADRSSWERYVPTVDIWLRVDDTELHYVRRLIPTLNWSGEPMGVRLVLEPANIEDFSKAFKIAYEAAQNTANSRTKVGGKKLDFSLWPTSLRDFLDKDSGLHKYFKVKAYVLDPSKHNDPLPQQLPPESYPLEHDPFDGLIKIDIINAQRGFSDANSDDASATADRQLSSQLRKYYDKHLNPADLPNPNDLDALEAIETAKTAFDDKLNASFRSAIGELEGLNYPGFGDPKIHLSSKLNPLEGLNHEAAVQFSVIPSDTSSSSAQTLYLPEKYNGLGYQNLISMVFKLIRFRDEWMRVGKAAQRLAQSVGFIEPLHLVLIEEPEAHLHAQVQQVFIKKAYGLLRNHNDLGQKKQFTTQVVVSTHSSHIAHEVDFACLRYFQRRSASCVGDVPCATVVNLSTTFGNCVDATSKFATRYLRTTHCDLFFADAAILVEGPAERMLVPHFIRHKFQDLDRSYLSLLEIGGSHAHRLKPLIDSLGLLTLVITDLDSIDDQKKKVIPEQGKGYQTSNSTLKQWAPRQESLDELLEASDDSKITKENEGMSRVAYQCPINITWHAGAATRVIPYTFEDALVLSNVDYFSRIAKKDLHGLMKKMVAAIGKRDIQEACGDMFEALKGGEKAEMALELLYRTDPGDLAPPQYIAEGLTWLQDQLKLRNREFVGEITIGGGDV